MKNQQINKNQGIVFPGGTGLVILKLLEKYGLKEAQETAIKKLATAKTYKEKFGAAEELPGSKIARIMKGVAENKITTKDFESALQQELNISKEKTSGLANDLEKEVLAFVKRVLIEEIESVPVTLGSNSEKPQAKPKEDKVLLEEELKKPPKKKDIYHEPIE